MSIKAANISLHNNELSDASAYVNLHAIMFLIFSYQICCSGVSSFYKTVVWMHDVYHNCEYSALVWFVVNTVAYFYMQVSIYSYKF